MDLKSKIEASNCLVEWTK